MKKDQNEEDHRSVGPEIKSGISRRGFLKGAGMTTAGAVVLQSCSFEASSDDQGKTFGPNEVIINMKINGKQRSVTIEPRLTLADVLREKLDLTGTKVVCDRGSCSACTVWLDGKPINACLTMAMDAVGKNVTTIEGLAQNGKLHVVQEKFIEYDASQCGYCTPGMVMSCAHLVNNNPNPTLEDVKHATRGNLCRCGTYPHVFKATLEAAKQV